jgi:hypothetical protein
LCWAGRGHEMAEEEKEKEEEEGKVKEGEERASV